MDVGIKEAAKFINRHKILIRQASCKLIMITADRG